MANFALANHLETSTAEIGKNGSKTSAARPFVPNSALENYAFGLWRTISPVTMKMTCSAMLVQRSAMRSRLLETTM